jgi:hypothetical protein
MKTTLLPLIVLIGGCSRLPPPPPAGDTAFAREQVLRARGTPSAVPRDEARVLRETVAALEPEAAKALREIAAGSEAEGLLALESPGVGDTTVVLRDASGGDALLAGAPLDLETILLATYARNPDVESSRAEWRSTIRLYDQASALEDVLLRYRAFARLGTPPAAAKGMAEAAFPYPGVLALKGEMIGAEVRMATENVRMRLRDALASAAMARADAAARAEEASLRAELVGLADRMLAAARARVRAGTGTQAELLEMEAERAMLENERLQAIAARAEAGARLNTLLSRAPGAPIALQPLADPPASTPDVAVLLSLADRYAPEPRMAKAEAERTAIAIRMAEAMLFQSSPPGAVAVRPMDGAQAGEMSGAADSGATMAGPPRPAMGGSMGGLRTDGGGPGRRATPTPGLPPGSEGPMSAAPQAVPAAIGAELGWIAELRERRVSLERKVEEAHLAASRAVVLAHLALDNARRMHAVAVGSTIPLATQAVEERLRLYESGRSDFAEVFGALRRAIDARLGAVTARQMYAEAEARTWMAAGARPSVVASAGGNDR